MQCVTNPECFPLIQTQREQECWVKKEGLRVVVVGGLGMFSWMHQFPLCPRDTYEINTR